MTAPAECPRFHGEHCRSFSCQACEGYDTRADAIQAQAARRLHALAGAASSLERRRARIVRSALRVAGIALGRADFDYLLDLVRRDARERAWAEWRVEIEAAVVEMPGAVARCDEWAREATARGIKAWAKQVLADARAEAATETAPTAADGSTP